MYKSLESMSDKLYYESVLPLSTCVSIYPGGVCYQSGVSADGLYQDTSRPYPELFYQDTHLAVYPPSLFGLTCHCQCKYQYWIVIPRQRFITRQYRSYCPDQSCPGVRRPPSSSRGPASCCRGRSGTCWCPAGAGPTRS